MSGTHEMPTVDGVPGHDGWDHEVGFLVVGSGGRGMTAAPAAHDRAEHGRVPRPDGSAVAGPYATGNTSAPVMGDEYAGPGATIGPSRAFGHLAARHAAGISADTGDP